MKSTGGHPDLERLGAYHDHELEAADVRNVEKHLEACPACRESLRQIAQVDILGPALRADTPGEAFWPGLAARIQDRLRADGLQDQTGADVTGRAEIGDNAGTRTAPARSNWWTRAFGTGPATLKWGLATAAGIVVLVLASRLIVNQMSPDQLARYSRADRFVANPENEAAPEAATQPPADSKEAATGAVSETPSSESLSDRVQETPSGSRRSEGEAGKLANGAGTAAGKSMDLTRSDHVAVFQKDEAAPPPPTALNPQPAPTATAPAAKAEIPSESSTQPRSESSTQARESQLSRPVQTADRAGVEAVDSALETGAGLAALRAAGQTHAVGETRSPAAKGAPGSLNEPLAYAALVDRELRPDSASAVLEGKISELADRLNAPTRSKPRPDDYRIAFAAALRALEAGRPDLARKGFSLVSHGLPESDLARDAEYNERLSQVRMLQQLGDDPELILSDAQERADQAWDRAQTHRIPATCRAALALERLRITLLEELRPQSDRAPFQERIRILKSCS